MLYDAGCEMLRRKRSGSPSVQTITRWIERDFILKPSPSKRVVGVANENRCSLGLCKISIDSVSAKKHGERKKEKKKSKEKYICRP